MKSEAATLTKPTIHRLLATTAAVAIGLACATASEVPLSIRLLGIAFGCYWAATCIFTFSVSLSSPAKEFCFLFGLPLYICCIVCTAVACASLIASLVSSIRHLNAL